MNNDQLYLPTFSLSLFISHTFAFSFAPLLELVFFPSASIFSFCSQFCSTAGVALTLTLALFRIRKLLKKENKEEMKERKSEGK